jgi:hypothetical protein
MLFDGVHNGIPSDSEAGADERPRVPPHSGWSAGEKRRACRFLQSAFDEQAPEPIARRQLVRSPGYVNAGSEALVDNVGSPVDPGGIITVVEIVGFVVGHRQQFAHPG